MIVLIRNVKAIENINVYHLNSRDLHYYDVDIVQRVLLQCQVYVGKGRRVSDTSNSYDCCCCSSQPVSAWWRHLPAPCAV